ncbi:PulJ/GspJ family protein [Calidithermus timidus]|uniref:PulJ/GspJ family protein n=1 Tax=Calidithermus timidus TaxID=307124 RepID=UPI0003702681|nr:hypothetical protein [Calidithermus timidus]
MTLVELLLAIAVASLLVAGAVRLMTVSSDQQQAVLQGADLQAELRRANSTVQQVLAERPFLLPLRGAPAGFEFLQGLPESRFQVLGVSATGLSVRFLNPSYDPRALRRVVVVDTGGNGYVYTLSRVTALDAATGLYSLEGTACAVPGGRGLRGVGATLARLGSGAALNTFAGSGSLGAGQLFFQQEDGAPEALMSAAAPNLRYVYRAPDGQTLYRETPLLFEQSGGQRYDLAGLSLSFELRSGQNTKEARRSLESDLLFQADAGLGLRRLDCSAAGPPPLAAGDWQVKVIGLDPGVEASVPIDGPGGFNRTLTAAAVLSGLQQGVYRLSANGVVHPALPFVRYRLTAPPEGRSLEVEVGGANRPVTTVAYTRLRGRLRVQVTSQPTGNPPRNLPQPVTLQAEGTFARYNPSLPEGTQVLEVEPGRYTLTWLELSDPSGLGKWVPDRAAGYSVDVPSEGEADGGVVRYSFKPYPYKLRLTLEYQGADVPSAEPIVCIQPSDEISGSIPPEAEIRDCLWR